jgi:hypothetical protein
LTRTHFDRARLSRWQIAGVAEPTVTRWTGRFVATDWNAPAASLFAGGLWVYRQGQPRLDAGARPPGPGRASLVRCQHG